MISPETIDTFKQALAHYHYIDFVASAVATDNEPAAIGLLKPLDLAELEIRTGKQFDGDELDAAWQAAKDFLEVGYFDHKLAMVGQEDRLVVDMEYVIGDIEGVCDATEYVSFSPHGHVEVQKTQSDGKPLAAYEYIEFGIVDIESWRFPEVPFYARKRVESEFEEIVVSLDASEEAIVVEAIRRLHHGISSLGGADEIIEPYCRELTISWPARSALSPHN